MGFWNWLFVARRTMFELTGVSGGGTENIWILSTNLRGTNYWQNFAKHSWFLRDSRPVSGGFLHEIWNYISLKAKHPCTNLNVSVRCIYLAFLVKIALIFWVAPGDSVSVREHRRHQGRHPQKRIQNNHTDHTEQKEWNHFLHSNSRRKTHAHGPNW